MSGRTRIQSRTYALLPQKSIFSIFLSSVSETVALINGEKSSINKDQEIIIKKTALQICSVRGLVIFLAVASTQAQPQYRAHIPFDFAIGQKSYKAGDYVIQSLNRDSAKTAVVIRDSKGRNGYLILTTSGEDPSSVTKGTLVFDLHGTQYFLAAIRTSYFIADLAKLKAKGRLVQDQRAQEKVVALVKKN